MRHYIPPFATARFHINNVTLEYKGSSPLPSISVGTTTPLVVGGLHPPLPGRQSVHPSQFYSPRAASLSQCATFLALLATTFPAALPRQVLGDDLLLDLCGGWRLLRKAWGLTRKEEYASVVYGLLEPGMEPACPRSW
jgi:hypothetical protein